MAPRGVPARLRAELAGQVQPGWARRAKCAGAGDDTWFPDGADQAWIPLSVCSVCPVIRSCLAYGLSVTGWGIWGGTDETERNRLVGQLRGGTPVPAVLDAAVSNNAGVSGTTRRAA